MKHQEQQSIFDYQLQVCIFPSVLKVTDEGAKVLLEF